MTRTGKSSTWESASRSRPPALQIIGFQLDLEVNLGSDEHAAKITLCRCMKNRLHSKESCKVDQDSSALYSISSPAQVQPKPLLLSKGDPPAA